MKKRRFLGYSLAELVIAIFIVGAVALLLLSQFSRSRQHEFNAKLDKAEANIAALLEQQSMLSTGRGEEMFRADGLIDVLKDDKSGLNVVDDGDDCWAADKGGAYADADKKFLLNDNTSIAIKSVDNENSGVGENIITTHIFLDANGPKAGPNEDRKDQRSITISFNKKTNKITFTHESAPGECICPSGKACPWGNSQLCGNGINTTCTCASGVRCPNGNLAECPSDTNGGENGGGNGGGNGGENNDGGNTGGECKCASGIACPNGSVSSCPITGGTGYCVCASGKACPQGDSAKCPSENNGNNTCKCASGKICPDGSISSCLAGGSGVGKCICPNGKACEDGTLKSCPGRGGCLCQDGSSCPSGNYKYCAENKCQTQCSGNKVQSDEYNPNCTCVCKAKTPENKENADWDNDTCSWSCKAAFSENRGSICCAPLGTGRKYESETSCTQVCDSDKGYVSTGTGCCKRGTKPANASWGTGAKACEWTCNALGNNEVWTDSSQCQKCTRGTKPANASWGTGAKACEWTCNALGNNEVWTDSSQCQKCTRGTKPSHSSWGTGANACKWSCESGYTSTGASCCKRTGSTGLAKRWGDEGTAQACQKVCRDTYGQKVYVIVDASPSGAHDVVNNLYEVLKSRAYSAGTPLSRTEIQELKTVWENVKKKDSTYADESQHTGRKIYIVGADGTILKTIGFTHNDIDNGNLNTILGNNGITKTGTSTTMGTGSGRYSGNSKLTGTYSLTVGGCSFSVPVTGFYSTSSPLVLDLLDDGFEFTSVEDGVMFDIDADGKVDKVAWTTKQKKFDNAFLVLDKNNNGQVDNGAELFGDQNGEQTGFGELAKYDDNGDKLITKADKIFNELRLWVDFNKDAHVDKGEWKTLEEAGVTELSTEYKVETDSNGNVKTDEHGNKVGFVGWFKQRVETVVNGVKTFVEKVKTMIDVFFQFR